LFIYFTVYLLRPSVIQIMHHGVNWKGCGRKQLQPNLRYYPDPCFKD